MVTLKVSCSGLIPLQCRSVVIRMCVCFVFWKSYFRIGPETGFPDCGGSLRASEEHTLIERNTFHMRYISKEKQAVKTRKDLNFIRTFCSCQLYIKILTSRIDKRNFVNY